MDERTGKLLSFLKEAEKLKDVERSLYTSGRYRKESTAEHSWHLAMFTLIFGREYDGLDMEKMVKLALVHDLAEIEVGDIWAFDEEGRKGKHEKESEAAKELFSMLPPDLEKEFLDLFHEYHEKETPEAKAVNAMDKMLPLLQNIINEGKSWKEHGLTLEDVDAIKRRHMEHDDNFMKLYLELMEEAREKEYFG